MSKLVLFDISKASARSRGQAKRYSQSKSGNEKCSRRQNPLERCKRVGRRRLQPMREIDGVDLIGDLFMSTTTSDLQYPMELDVDLLGPLQHCPVVLVPEANQSSAEPSSYHGGADTGRLPGSVHRSEIRNQQEPATKRHVGMRNGYPELLQQGEVMLCAQLPDEETATPQQMIQSRHPWVQNLIEKPHGLENDPLRADTNSDLEYFNDDHDLLRVALCVELGSYSFDKHCWQDYYRWLFPYLDYDAARKIADVYSASILTGTSDRMYRNFGICPKYALLNLKGTSPDDSGATAWMGSSSILSTIRAERDQTGGYEHLAGAQATKLLLMLSYLHDRAVLDQKIGCNSKKWKQLRVGHVHRTDRLSFFYPDMTRVNWKETPLGLPPIVRHSLPGLDLESLKTQTAGPSPSLAEKTNSSVYSFSKWVKSISTNGSIQDERTKQN